MGYMDKQRARREEVAKFHLPERGEKMFRKIGIYYDEGGVNYWNYQNKPRGFYFNSHVCEISGGFETWTTGQAGDGYILIEEAKRFNAKRLHQLAENAKKFAEQINTMLDKPVHGYVDYIIRVSCFGSEK